MKYQCTLLEVGSLVEEDVVIQVGDITLAAFANICPFAIAIGQRYVVELSLWADDELCLKETTREKGIERDPAIDQYIITGDLNGERLDAGIVFEESIFATEYKFLSGKRVVVCPSRINVAFVEPVQ